MFLYQIGFLWSAFVRESAGNLLQFSPFFHVLQTTPVAELYQLKKGEAVELINGDQFYFIATECLLTVFIKQHDAELCQELSSQVVSPQIPPPTIEQLRQCSALVTTSVSGIQPEDVQIQATTNPDIENGKSVPPDLCPGERETLSSSHVVCLGQGQMMQMAVDRRGEDSMRMDDRSVESTLLEDVAPHSWPAGPVEGMEDVIASISGYSGHDRSNLIKLIYKTGGAYTGGVSAANTHLVCFFLNSK